MKKEAFKASILKSLQPRTPLDANFVNMQYDKPMIILVPMIEEMDESFPPFYISLNIHDKILHNCLLDLGASHSLMPKAVMDELRLKKHSDGHSGS